MDNGGLSRQLLLEMWFRDNLICALGIVKLIRRILFIEKGFNLLEKYYSRRIYLMVVLNLTRRTLFKENILVYKLNFVYRHFLPEI